MRRPLLLALLALPLASVAHAAEGGADSRLRTVFYRADHVVTVAARPGFQSAVAFADDERIENIAVGDSMAWQVTPNKRANLLFVKPMSAPSRTNMTVVTDRRVYLFDLVTAGGKAPPVYALRFTYPAPPPAPKPVEVKPAAAPAAKAPPALNFAWATRGDPEVLPARLFDDGTRTYMAWAKDRPLPAVLIRNAEGAEGPAEFMLDGDYLVVDGVAQTLVLRSGKLMATLTPERRAAPAARPDLPASLAER